MTHGRPCVLYELPHLLGAQDYKQQIDLDAVDVCIEECIMDAGKAMDSDIAELLEIIMAENNLQHADNMEEAVHLYIQLRQLINHILFDV